jgi:replication-associated recombination protein RarA
MNIAKLLFAKVRSTDSFFQDIVGYEGVKKLFMMSLDSKEPVSILLSGPPASAKTMFLEALMKLNCSYFIDGGNSTKAGMIDYVFENKPKYLLIDEIDKMSAKDQSFLLNLMETGIVAETKYGKTRSAQIKTSVFATSNNITKIVPPLQSRFFVVKLEPYTYDQFYQIAIDLLTMKHKVSEEIAEAAVNAVWNNTGNIRDCVKIGRMAKSIEDINFLRDSFLKHF